MGMRIAIVGAGIGGLALASFLAKYGHDVTVFDRFPEPKPVGAGLLLQPVGLAVLAHLGLDEPAIALGSRIDYLKGFNRGRPWPTIHVRYSDASDGLFGVGSRRRDLFGLLWNKARASGVAIEASADVKGVDRDHVVMISGASFGPFDLVVDASGQASRLRSMHAKIKRHHIYPYGALWALAPYDRAALDPRCLSQRYDGSRRMCGIMPVGDDEATFYWSFKRDQLGAWRASGFDTWKQEVIALWPEAKTCVDAFGSHDDLHFADYRDVVLKSDLVIEDGAAPLVFLGDACHATSPQLGQGANLALLDAFVLAAMVRDHASLEDALAAYSKARRGHVGFYQWASRWLTPFFQRDGWLGGALRFFVCDIPCMLPPTRMIGATVLMGMRKSSFSSFDPGDIHDRYRRYPTNQ